MQLKETKLCLECEEELSLKMYFYFNLLFLSWNQLEASSFETAFQVATKWQNSAEKVPRIIWMAF